MTVEVIVRDEGRMIDFGDRVRVERRAKAERGEDGSVVHRWVTYELVPSERGEDGKLYHPVLGLETALTHVWVIRGVGTNAEALELAERIAG